MRRGVGLRARSRGRRRRRGSGRGRFFVGRLWEGAGGRGGRVEGNANYRVLGHSLEIEKPAFVRKNNRNLKEMIQGEWKTIFRVRSSIVMRVWVRYSSRGCRRSRNLTENFSPKFDADTRKSQRAIKENVKFHTGLIFFLKRAYLGRRGR